MENEQQKGISLIIPFAKNGNIENLNKVILSWGRFFCPEIDFQIVIIGADNTEFHRKENGILHIPHEPLENPQADLIEKLKILIADPNVSDTMIIANPDTYVVSPIHLPDIAVLKINGTLQDVPTREKTETEVIKRTIKLLTDSGVPTFNYETKLPVVFHKENLVSVFEKYPSINEKPVCIASLYFNDRYPGFIPIRLDWKTDNFLLPVVSANPNPERFNQLLATKKFLFISSPEPFPWLVSRLQELIE